MTGPIPRYALNHVTDAQVSTRPFAADVRRCHWLPGIMAPQVHVRLPAGDLLHDAERPEHGQRRLAQASGPVDGPGRPAKARGRAIRIAALQEQRRFSPERADVLSAHRCVGRLFTGGRADRLWHGERC